MNNADSQPNSETVVGNDDSANEYGKDIFRAIEVPENLTRYVKRISLADCTEPVTLSTVVKPTGCTFLDILLRGEIICTVDTVATHRTKGELLIPGQIRDEEIQLDFSGPIGHLVVHFAPLGAYELLGVSGEMVAGQVGVAAQVSDRARPMALELAKLCATASSAEIAHLSLSAITRHLSNCAQQPLLLPDYLHQAVAIADQHDGAVRVSKMASEVGVSERQLSREFSRFVGLSPKFYCRVLQINSALENMLRDDGQQMIDVALQGDFADQAHFNRVFRQFLDMSPREFLNSDEFMLSHFLANWQGPHHA